MEILLVALIAALLNTALIFVSTALDTLAPMAFHAERVIGSGFSANTVTDLYNIMLTYGIALIVLKFLKKGFEAYTLWTDGDPDSDPILLVTNFIKALAVALGFTFAYDWICDVAENILNALLAQVQVSTTMTMQGYIAQVASLGLFDAVVSLVFFVFWFLLYIQFIMRGLEIMVLRIGMPIACLGLLDSDKGIFKPYLQKFFQNAATVIVQIVLCRLGVNLLLNNHCVWGVAAMMTALSTPKFLHEFMLAAGGNVNISNSVYHTARIGQMVKGLVRKK
ncbi:hypothetical protein FACS1894208_12490 [Clostridia bacterium]|nr:hypothetical protein FACS1894208_12490 [Clostridia bacterium]